jgi:hypothetical protein
MTFNHPVLNQADVPAGQAALVTFGPTPTAHNAGRLNFQRVKALFPFQLCIPIQHNCNGSRQAFGRVDQKALAVRTDVPAKTFQR